MSLCVCVCVCVYVGGCLDACVCVCAHARAFVGSPVNIAAGRGLLMTVVITD